MKLRSLLCVFSIFLFTLSAAAADDRVDVLDYFIPSPDIAAHYMIGDFNVHACPDPDNAAAQTLILHKGSSSNSYEIYEVTPTQLQIRYEVVRPDPHGSAGNWIRRYHELDPALSPTAGMLWMPRYVTPGKTDFYSHAAVDRYVFDPVIGAYVIKPTLSSEDAVSYNSVIWSSDPWRSNNRTGLPINSVIRLVSEWQPDGKIFETYDYARGLGLINWQWMERISDLRPVSGDKTDKIFYCENGAVYIQSKGDASHSPSVFQYNLKKRRIMAPLPVMLFTSHWAAHLGPQWYVIYRDLSREGVLKKQRKSLANSFALPEWYTHPGATIADLPGFYTRAK